MNALRMLMYSCLCFCPLTHLQSDEKTKQNSYLSPLKTTFVSWRHDWHHFGKVFYLCLNVCTLTPAPESSGHIATYIPILYLMSAQSHL